MARKIIINPLPVGHAHDDIDGCFGIIWKYLYKYRNINNFSEFRQGVEQAFKDEDGTMIIVPDYKQFYDPVLDSRLSELHKGYHHIDFVMKIIEFVLSFL